MLETRSDGLTPPHWQRRPKGAMHAQYVHSGSVVCLQAARLPLPPRASEPQAFASPDSTSSTISCQLELVTVAPRRLAARCLAQFHVPAGSPELELARRRQSPSGGRRAAGAGGADHPRGPAPAASRRPRWRSARGRTAGVSSFRVTVWHWHLHLGE